MQQVMDRCWEALTEIDNVIRRQRRAMATVAAMTNLNELETARTLVQKAHMVLARIQADALLPPASASQSETPSAPPGK